MDDDDAFLYGDSADVKEEVRSQDVKDGESPLCFSEINNSF